jgi:hypothetical protein
VRDHPAQARDRDLGVARLALLDERLERRQVERVVFRPPAGAGDRDEPVDAAAGELADPPVRSQSSPKNGNEFFSRGPRDGSVTGGVAGS